MPQIFGPVLHPGNACIAGYQETNALYSQLPSSTFIEINFLDSSSDANKALFYKLIFDSSTVAV